MFTQVTPTVSHPTHPFLLLMYPPKVFPFGAQTCAKSASLEAALDDERQLSTREREAGTAKTGLGFLDAIFCEAKAQNSKLILRGPRMVP